MRTIAIIGSGPAGFYTAEAALKEFGEDVRVDILDRLPTPYGLIRAGVAPDHQSIKAVARRYEAVATDPRVRFRGNLNIGEDVSVAELVERYDDVVLATGAPVDRPLEIPGNGLHGVLGSAAFVGWYNGHPDFQDLAPPLSVESAVVIGNGNVAIDCARILAKSVGELSDSDIVGQALEPGIRAGLKEVHILGRRGPQQVSFTLKEVGELGELEMATPVVKAEDFPPAEADASLEIGQRRVVAVLRKFVAQGPDTEKSIRISLDFFHRPTRILGEGRVEAVEVMKTRLNPDGEVVDTGETLVIPCGLVVAAIGYRTSPVPGVPYDSRAGRFANEDGLISPGLWCVGWARRGPSGTIGTNRPDGISIVERIAAANGKTGKAGPAALDALLAERGISASDFADWRRIDALEVSRARPGAPREKITSLEEMRKVIQE